MSDEAPVEIGCAECQSGVFHIMFCDRDGRNSYIPVCVECGHPFDALEPLEHPKFKAQRDELLEAGKAVCESFFCLDADNFAETVTKHLDTIEPLGAIIARIVREAKAEAKE